VLTDGAVFESSPSTLVLPPLPCPESVSLSSASSASMGSSLSSIEYASLQVSLAGIPRAPGTLLIIGYSTHVLGVKSNCLLEDVNHLPEANQYSIEVVPAMPQLQVLKFYLANFNSLDVKLVSTDNYVAA